MSPRRRLLLLGLLLTGCVPASSGVGGPLPELSSVPPVTRAPSASEAPTAAATASAAATPTPGPSASLDPSALELSATSCHGGVVLEWSASAAADFHHYTALRSPEEEIEPDWPPIAPAVDWGRTYATDRFVTSGVDASIIPSARTWFYRVMAYDAEDRVVGSSPVRSARLIPVRPLADLAIEAGPDGTTHLRWGAYGGYSGCFGGYEVLYGTTTASTALAVVADQGTLALETDALQPGTTYRLRVRAVRATPLGSFVLGETDTVTYTVP